MKPAGEWNHMEITADKAIVKVALNGETRGDGPRQVHRARQEHRRLKDQFEKA